MKACAWILSVLLLAASHQATAAPSPTIFPVYHGRLDIGGSRGRIRTTSGIASLRLRNWRLAPPQTSDGLFVDQEPLLIAIGEFDAFRLESNSVVPRRGGRRFVYRNQQSISRGIKRISFLRKADGSYRVDAVLRGVDLSRLNSTDPACVPVAIIVGDDDGFSGVSFSRTSFRATRVRVTGVCTIDVNWQWLEQCGPQGAC